MSYQRLITLNLRSEGLGLQAQIRDDAGSDVGALITTGFVELGNGSYSKVLTLDDSLIGSVEVTDTNTGRNYGVLAINPTANSSSNDFLVSQILDSLSTSSIEINLTAGAVINGRNIEAVRGERWVIEFTVPGVLDCFLIKNKVTDKAEESLLRVTKLEGLTHINKITSEEAGLTSNLGSIVEGSEPNKYILTLNEVASTLIKLGSLGRLSTNYAIQYTTVSSGPREGKGTIDIKADWVEL